MMNPRETFRLGPPAAVLSRTPLGSDKTLGPCFRVKARPLPTERPLATKHDSLLFATQTSKHNHNLKRQPQSCVPDYILHTSTAKPSISSTLLTPLCSL